jgi:hypothetical protein
MSLRTWVWASACTVAALSSVDRGGAQEGPIGRFSVEVRAGYDHPSAELGRTATLESNGYVDFGQADPGFALGIGASVRLTERLGLRVALDHGFARSVRGQWLCAPFVACPAVIVTADGRLRRWSLSGDLQFAPRLSGCAVRPMVFVGAGWRQHRLGWTTAPDIPVPTAYHESDAFGRAGIGASRELGPVTLFAELEALFGPFGSGEELFIEGSVPANRNTQLDMGVTAGIRLGVG